MIRVLVVTSMHLLSDLIEAVCRNQPDIRLVGAQSNKAGALQHAKECDVMLVSHDIPDVMSLVQTLGESSNPAVIVMNVPNIEPLILHYVEAGAAGCIREQDSVQELVQAIRLVTAHRVALPAELYPFVLERVSTLGNQQHTSHSLDNEKTLTRREREILQLIAQGYENRAIARELTIELGTTKNHVHNILDKLNVKTRRDAAVYYSLGLA